MTLQELIDNPEMLELCRKSVEDVLIDYRDSRIAVLRNNGLVCKERDGTPSHIIRLSIEMAIVIALNAVIKNEAEKGNDNATLAREETQGR